MRIWTIPGRKAKDDRIVMIETCGPEAVRFEDIARMLLPLMENEERLYPSRLGQRGWRKPLDLMRLAYARGLEHALYWHGLERQQQLSDDETWFQFADVLNGDEPDVDEEGRPYKGRRAQ